MGREAAMNRNHRRKESGLPNRSMATLPVTLIVLLVCVSAPGQQIGDPTTQQGVTPPRGTYAIRNARIFPVTGPPIENGTLVIRDGKIEAVGPSVSIPGGA